MALKKKPVTGMKDMLPKEMEIRDYVIQMIKDTYKTNVLVHGIDRSGFVADVSVTVANLHVPMHTLLARELPDHQAEVRLTIETQGVEQLRVDSVVRM